MTPPKIVIVGGGLCGLVAATILQQNYKVSVLDKGFGIGGRLASRRLRKDDQVVGIFDYGMQSFSATHPTFRGWLESLVAQKIVTPWGDSARHPDGNDSPKAHSLYRGVDSNRAIAQYLAQGLHIVNQTRIERLTWDDQQWRLQATDNRTFEADAVLMTAPVPQALEIIEQSKLPLADKVRSQLNHVRYAPCLSLMAVLDQPSSIPAPGTLKLNDSILYWLASNHQTGISKGYAITLLATPDYSQRCWEDDPEAIIADMLNAAKDWLKAEHAIATRLHRWKYSYPTQVFGARSLPLLQTGPLVLAGDAFCPLPVEISQSLEQAYLSGIAAAQQLSALI